MIIISAIGASIALVELGFIFYKYSKETIRKRRSETIVFYNSIFNNTYDLLEEYFKKTGKKLFISEDICNDPDLYKKTMNHLTVLESFAKGLEYKVYDFKTFIYLTPNEIFEIFNSLKQFVYDQRKAKSYNLLFNDFLSLTDFMSLCIKNKLQGKKIKLSYKKFKRCTK